MIRRLLLPALLLPILLYIGCVTSRGGAAQAPMSSGERLYRANCASCHRLIEPSRFSDEQWPDLVRRYGGRLNLSVEVESQILEFLRSAN